MKKYILTAIALLGTNQLFSADIDQSSLASLPSELKQLISQFTATSSDFDESIESIKKIISINKSWSQLLNEPNKIEPLLSQLSQQFNTTKSAIAFALGTKGAQVWLKKQDPNFTFLKIFGELAQDKYLNSGFFNSKYFTQLANELSIQTLLDFNSYMNERLKEISQAEYPNERFTYTIDDVLDTDQKKIAYSDLYSAQKNFAILLVALQDKLATMPNGNEIMKQIAYTILEAQKTLKNDILPKLKDGSFKTNVLKAIERKFPNYDTDEEAKEFERRIAPNIEGVRRRFNPTRTERIIDYLRKLFR